MEKIRTTKEHSEALRKVEDLILLDPDVGTPEASKLSELSNFIEEFESDVFTFEKTAMTPEEFYKVISDIVINYAGDTEVLHSQIDVAMEKLLVELGYGDAIDVIRAQIGYYS